jgi:hypothetical protein
MSKSCFNCGFPIEKKRGIKKMDVMQKSCKDCKKLAPRQSLRPVNSPKKSKQK